MKTRLSALLLSALLVTAVAGCGKEPMAPQAKANSQAPGVPPTSSMKFDFALFDRNNAAQLAAQYPKGAAVEMDRSNWINAVVRVVYINLTVADLFADPMLALDAALHQTPTLGSDGWWTWVFAFDKDGHHVTLRLRAYVNGQLVTWRMLVTDPAATPALADFEWFRGETQLANNSGFWLFNAPVGDAAVAIARIDWSNSSATKRQLSFRNVNEGTPDFGDLLEYQVDGADVSLTFHDASAATDAEIAWNEVNGRGSIQVPDYNGGVRGCWDETQQNADCEAAVVAKR